VRLQPSSYQPRLTVALRLYSAQGPHGLPDASEIEPRWYFLFPEVSLHWMGRQHTQENYLRRLALFAGLLLLLSIAASSQPVHTTAHDSITGSQSPPTLVRSVLITNSQDDFLFDDECPSLIEASALPSDSRAATPIWECHSLYQSDLRIPCHNRGPPRHS
jgi:hypothetical protein